jgi:hypothetical protein
VALGGGPAADACATTEAMINSAVA